MPTASGISSQWMMAEEVYTNEVQTLTGTPSAPFSLIFDGAQTPVGGLIAAATAPQVQAALEALPNIGVGGVVCSGGALPAVITCTFSGALVKGRNLPQLIVQTGITGLTPATTVPGTGYGDAVTVTRGLELKDESMKLDIGRNETEGIRAGNRYQRTDRWAPSKRQAAGDLNFEVPSKGFSMLLGQAFGSDAVITTPSGATATRDHTFTPGDFTQRSFTQQMGTPDTTGTVRPFTYLGNMITDFEFSLGVDSILMAKFGCDAMDESVVIALASVSYAATFEMLYWGGGQATIAGANVDVKDFKFTGENSLNTDRFFNRAATTSGGPTLKKQPIANGFANYTGELNMEFDALTTYQRFVGSGTGIPATAAIVLTCQGSVIEAGGGATINPRFGLTFTFPFCRFDGETPDNKDQDITEFKAPVKMLWDGTTPPFTCVYRTTDTTK